MPKKAYRSSALTDNVRPGAPTTMDVLMRWITKPGNVRRWRNDPRPPLLREIVDIMQKEGLVHRQAPFVRYKLDAIEKQYITAKQWLLETGMHDAYMRGRATKDVRANVDHVCPQFRTLDPVFRGVPFSKKNAETIELDGDSTEDVEQEEKDGESEEIGEEEEWEEEEEEQTKKVEEKAATPVELPQKKNTFRSRLFPEKGNAEKEKTLMPNEDRQKKAQTFRDRLFAQKENAAGVEKPSTTEPQQKNGNTVKERNQVEKDNATQKKVSPSPVRQKKTSVLVRRLASSSGYAAAEKVRSSTTTGPQEEAASSRDQVSSLASNVAGKGNVSLPVEPKQKTSTGDQLSTAAVQAAMEQAAPEAAKSAPAAAPKKRGRPPKSATVVPPKPNGGKETAQAANDKNATVPKTKAAKRKNSEETSTSAAKRTRVQVQDWTERKDFMEIERVALLKRVNDEEKQRHEMYKLERAKLECELESKQVQLLFEKAAARKKLDQLGVPEEEINRILPL